MNNNSQYAVRHREEALVFRQKIEELIAHFENDTDYDAFGPNARRTVTFSLAHERGSQHWFSVTTTYAVLLKLLSAGIITDRKDYIMMCAGPLKGGNSPEGTRKIKNNVETLHFVILDFDKGDAPPDQLEARMRELNIECAMFETYSSGKDTTELVWSVERPNPKTGVIETVKSAFQAFVSQRLGATAPGTEYVTSNLAKAYLVEKLSFKPEVLGEVSILLTEKTDRTIRFEDGKPYEIATHSIVVSHFPIAKTRLVIPLTDPVERRSGETETEFQRRWTDEYYNPFGWLIGFQFDKACASTERGHYAMTVRDGSKPSPTRVVHGDYVNLQDEKFSKLLSPFRSERNERRSATNDKGSQEETSQKERKCNMSDRSDWNGFKAADAAADCLPSVTDKRDNPDQPLVAFPCPFVHEHATSNDPSAHQCYAFNASSPDQIPTVKCQSDTCKDRPDPHPDWYSFISGLRSGYGPCWTGLRTRLV